MKALQKIALSAIFVMMLAFLLIIIFGDNGLLELYRLRDTHQQIVKLKGDLTAENMRLYRNIDRLQNDPTYIESIARRELGMIRADEMIFTFKHKNRQR